MKVSIIMTAYNSAIYIERAIESIISQTYTNWELIISDDKSPTDKTVEIIQRYADKDNRIKFFAQEKNLGYLDNKNWALKKATGDLITQLDSDDVSRPDRIEKQLAPFIKDPELKICGSNFELIDTEDNVLESKQYEEDYIITEIAIEYPFWFPGLMVKSELFEEFGYFHDYFGDIYGDDQYWTWVVNNKYPIYFVKDVLYSYRINPTSITSSYSNPRDMMAREILFKLFSQIKETGTDWLQNKEDQKLFDYEKQLLNDKTLMAERYGTWAAKAIDKDDWEAAKKLLKKVFQYKKTSVSSYRTLFYYFRKRYLNV